RRGAAGEGTPERGEREGGGESDTESRVAPRPLASDRRVGERPPDPGGAVSRQRYLVEETRRRHAPLELGEESAAPGAGDDVRRQRGRLGPRQRAVGVERERAARVSHTSPFAKSVASARCARQSLEATVPIERSSAPAISSYESCATWRRTTTSL